MIPWRSTWNLCVMRDLPSEKNCLLAGRGVYRKPFAMKRPGGAAPPLDDAVPSHPWVEFPTEWGIFGPLGVGIGRFSRRSAASGSGISLASSNPWGRR